MALTRKMLEELGLDKEAVDKAIEAHLETVEALKKENDKLEKRISEIDIDSFKSKIAELTSEKKELESTKAEYEKYKNEVANKELKASKIAKLTEALRASKVNEQILPLLIKASNVDEIELDEKGEFVKSPIDELKKEYSQLFEAPVTEINGVNTSVPPSENAKDKEDLFLQGLNK